MQGYQANDRGQSAPDTDGVINFASQVVSLLAEKNLRTTGEPRETVVNSLISAALTGGTERFATLLAEMRRLRISAAALADIYIPFAARKMGDDWLEDDLSWMEVSIAMARLQSLLREIGSAWAADRAGDAGSGSVLLIIPNSEQHTLGPMVAMGQMRRFGISVCLRISPSAEELRSLLADRAFDGVMISVAVEEKLDTVRKLVSFIKGVRAAPMPVIIGGAIMTRFEDAAPSTGADLSTNDIGVALEALGLKFDDFCVLKRA
jgi:MerR family transcriptional regulator, light-induced transcriptional regulator